MVRVTELRAERPAGGWWIIKKAVSVSAVGGSTSSPGTLSSFATQHPYQFAYNNLQVYDTQELFNVSFGSPENAMANVLSVLSQWAAYQKNGYASAPSAPLLLNALA